ncbi:hypothetical protein [Scytonema sp. PCC 10023]|uniref:hypothetical protein n=1 Tax=Scytonema sp. PCC 10023 TaxID=1680591 RepID=UPI0039C6390C
MSYSPITSNPVTGFEALQRQLRRLGYTSDSQIWIKVSNNKIHTAKLTESGLAVWECRKEKDAEGNPIPDPKGGSIWNKGKYHPNGYQYLLSLAQQGEEMFYIVNHPKDGIGAGHTSKFNCIFIECDSDALSVQWEKINRRAAEFGLVPSLVVFSGGKSLHVYYSLTTEVDPETWQRLQRKAIAVFTSDPVIQNHNREMRLAGFPRIKKGKYQSLEFESETAYAPEELESILDKAGGFTQGLSKERWGEIFRFLRNRKLSHQEKEAKVREVAALPEENLPENIRHVKLEIKRAQRRTGTIGSNNLLDAVNQAAVKLGSDAFDWVGHKWKWDGSGKARGCCPWHASTSGTSAWIAPRKNGDGWGFACLSCTDNRQINAFAYWWQLRHGLGATYPTGKAWVEAAKEFCEFAGVIVSELPQQQWDEPDEELYQEFLKREADFERWQEYCDRHIELQQEESFKSFFSNRLQKLKSKALALRCSPKFQAKKSRSFWSDDNAVTFEAEDHLATIQALAQQAAAENKRLIVLDNSEGGTGKSHLAGQLTLDLLGVNTIFYTSPTHRNPTVASIEQNYTDLPVRHDGLVSDATQLTPLNAPYVRWAKPGEEANIEGNCSKAHLFHIFASKGYDAETQAEAASNPICATCKWKSNCAGVDKLPTIPRHTFRQERRDALASDRIRCNLDSLPDITKMQSTPKEEGGNPKRVAVIVDEFTQFRGYSQTQTTLSDFDNAWMYFKSQVHNAEKTIKQFKEQQRHLQREINAKMAESEKLEGHLALMNAHQQLDLGFLPKSKDDKAEKIKQLEFEIAQLDAEVADLIKESVAISEKIAEVEKNTKELPDAIAALEPIIFALRSILNGEHDITSETRYGWDESAIRTILGDLTGLEKHLAVIRALSPKLATLLKESDSVTLDGMASEDRRGSAAALRAARHAMQKEADKENREAIANMPSNCIVPLLEILLGEKRGSFRVSFKELTIFTRDDRHREQLKQADFTLILDGTKTRESLAQDLDVDPSEIIVIRQQRKRHANLKIVQVTGMGLLGRDRSESMKQRVKAITGAILEQHGEENVGVLDHSACVGNSAEEAESGYWFHDNRGSNAFQQKSALLTFGTPFSNIGQLQLEYTTLTGDRNPNEGNPQFTTFVQERVQSEVAQCGWRLRSSRREGEQLIWYVASDQDLNYLREYFPDAEFELKTAFQITPSAGSLGEQTCWAVLEASKQVIDAGKELTTKAIAQIVGCNRSRISQIAKEVVGGFAAFKRVLMFLLKSLYRTTNTPLSDGDALTEDEFFAAKTYLPLVLEENAQTPEDGVKQIMESAESLGKESFERVLRALSFNDRAQLLGQMLTMLPQEWQQEFLALGKLLEEQVADQAIAS